LFLSYHSLSRPRKMVRTIAQASTWAALAGTLSAASGTSYESHLLPQGPALEELIAVG
jgi:hypothetical protein